jgi:branched-chain amino acid transport system substrate-binding protein
MNKRYNETKLALGHQLAFGRRSFLKGTGALFASSLFPVPAKAAQTVKIGVVLPLSGPNAQFGVNSRNGIQLVVDEVNAAGGIKALGGAKVELVIADATSSPTGAATVAQRMVTQDRVVGVLGCYVSSLTIAVSEVTERRGIPLITMSFADQITGRGFKNVFQVSSKGSTIGRAQLSTTLAVARRAGEQISKIAIAYEDTAYGTAQATGLRAAAEKSGVQIVMDEAYPLGITDVTPLINRLRVSEAEVVFPVSYLNDSLLIIRTMRQQQINTPAIGGAAGYVIPDFHKGLGEYSEGVLSITAANYDTAPDLTSRFKRRYGYFMVLEALTHAVAASVLIQAIEAARSSEPAAVRDKLASVIFSEGWAKAMPGGAVEFDNTGLNMRAYPTLVQWQGGELVTVHPEAVAKAKPLWRGKQVL